MTRIIAGTAGGRRLRTPRGELTRPTADRVREALFSAVEAMLGRTSGSLQGVRFLDLYAGSGAVGLEAWSRGAAQVTLVEKDRRTAALVRDNAAGLGATAARVVASSVRRVLTESPVTAYDVVFLDPPYAATAASVPGDLLPLVGRGWLAPDAVVVVEHSARRPPGAADGGWPGSWPEGLVAERTRSYGETALSYARHAPPEQA